MQAFSRLANELGVTELDGVGHSAGAMMLSYASKYAPSLFRRAVYAEPPGVFFTHASKAWPFLFTQFSLERLWRGLVRLDSTIISNWLIMSEVHHQQMLKNVTWFMETCHFEYPGSLGERAMLVLGEKDHYVNGHAMRTYFGKHHPKTTVHLMPGWIHGSFWMPTNLQTVMRMLRGFLLRPDAVKELAPATTVRHSRRSRSPMRA